MCKHMIVGYDDVMNPPANDEESVGRDKDVHMLDLPVGCGDYRTRDDTSGLLRSRDYLE